MSTLATLIVKAKQENRPIADLLRDWGSAGCPEFDPAHLFWTGVTEAEVSNLADWRELQAASAELARSEPTPTAGWTRSLVTKTSSELAEGFDTQATPEPKIATCQDCRALHTAGEPCPCCAADPK